MRLRLVGIIAVAALFPVSISAADPRPIRVDDLFAIKEVEDPQLSPDGKWVAWASGQMDEKKDTSDTDIYLSPIGGGEAMRLTAGKKSESSPRFSPDGKWIAFLSSRDGKSSQVWLLPRAGGEAVKLTDYKTGVSSMTWSPDSKRMVCVITDIDPDDPPDGEDDDVEKSGKDKTAKPIVTRRVQFKRDYEGYLKEIRQHLHIFDVEKKLSIQITAGPFDDDSPEWSPDGKLIAFVSDRTLPDPDLSQNSDIFVVDARAGAIPRPVTSNPGSDSSPAFSPDGLWIAHVAGGDPKDMWYGASHLALAPVAGGPARPLTAALDRNVSSPRFTPDGRSVLFLLEDGGVQPLARVGIDGGAVTRLVAGEREVSAFDVAPSGAIVVLESSSDQPAEISSVGEAGALTRVTRANDAVMAGLRLGRTERFTTKSPDGTSVDGFLVHPPGDMAGKMLPAILRIHGGPTSQYASSFHFEWQLLAAQGYAIIASNPRGSTGYGTKFSRAIWADWGNVDTQDVLAAVDHVVAMGVADPERLGVGGWSYGGMMTNYVIARSPRFKAAVSGSSISNMLAGYGTDHYQYEYEVELGLPWKDRAPWDNVSHPFFNVEKIVTHTLFMCGQLDMNVPLLNTEQMYQALRRVGKVDTELVIYPGQWHGIGTPSYQKDRFERYIAWYDRYLKPASAVRPKGMAAEKKPVATSLLGRPLFAVEPTVAARTGLEENLAKATAEFLKKPDDVSVVLWLGRRQAYLGEYRDAIATWTRGIAAHPRDASLLRHRGHRYISVREFDNAIADLTKAAGLIMGKPDVPDPGSDPNAPSTNTLRYSIHYHLGLAHYLKGDFAAAEKAWRQCLEAAKGADERLVGVSDWLYTTLRRLGKNDDAARLLDPIHAGMKVEESAVYLNRLLMYKGVYAPEDLLRAGGDDLQRATYGYAVGMQHLLSGRKAEAKAVFTSVVALSQWPAFGYIASEIELARMK